MSFHVASVWVRGVPQSFTDGERTDRTLLLNVDAARRQHLAYTECLVEHIGRVEAFPADVNYPDCPFVEDGIVVLTHDLAVLTRSGAPSRRGEFDEILGVLPMRDLRRLEAPATLDGGDVLRIDARLFVGISTRTNEAGADALARISRTVGVDVIKMDVRSGLHLKSACTIASPHLLLYAPNVGLNLAPFVEAGVACVAVTESAGANVLALGSNRVLVSAAAPRTAEILDARQLDVSVVDIGEFHKADGALTCCSVRIPPRTGWCT